MRFDLHYLLLEIWIWQRPHWRRGGQAADEYVELVFNYDLHHNRDRDPVLVNCRTDRPSNSSHAASEFHRRRAQLARSGAIFAFNDVPPLVLYALLALLRGFADVRVCLLQHAKAVLVGVHADAVVWRLGNRQRQLRDRCDLPLFVGRRNGGCTGRRDFDA